MKKIIGILSIFLGIGLIVSFVVAFAGDIPVNVPKSSSFVFKLMTGIEVFSRFLPAIAITGFIVTLSVHFGRNCEGSTSRFSKAMMDRYKIVMIVSISIACALTLFAELFGMLASSKKSSIISNIYLSIVFLCHNTYIIQFSFIYSSRFLHKNFSIHLFLKQSIFHINFQFHLLIYSFFHAFFTHILFIYLKIGRTA